MFAMALKKGEKTTKTRDRFTFVEGAIQQIILSRTINACYKINHVCRFGFTKSCHVTNMISFFLLETKVLPKHKLDQVILPFVLFSTLCFHFIQDKLITEASL